MAIYSPSYKNLLLLISIFLSIDCINAVHVNRPGSNRLVQSSMPGYLLALQEIISFSQISQGDTVLKSLESAVRQNNTDNYLCYNYDNKTLTLLQTNKSQVDDLEKTFPVLCFYQDLIVDVIMTGFWYELCYEFQSSYNICYNQNATNSEECFAGGLKYYSQMYYSQRIYLGLFLSSKFRDRIHSRCVDYYEEDEKFNVTIEALNSGFQQLDIASLKNDSDWKFVPTVASAVNLQGLYSYDMELFFDVKDARQLYKWDTQEFLAICELASGDFAECQKVEFNDTEKFRICIERHIVQLGCFNYLSEDDTARRILYEVCKMNLSKHDLTTQNDKAQISTQKDSKFLNNSQSSNITNSSKPIDQDDMKFIDSFDNFERFSDLFE